MLDQVANFLLKNPTISATLIIPMWPAQIWFSKLWQLADQIYILPRCKSLFLPSFYSNQAPLNNRTWETLALTIPNNRTNNPPMISKLYVPNLITTK